MALVVRYSETLSNGPFIHRPATCCSTTTAIAFANHWEELRRIYFAANIVVTDDMLDIDDSILKESG